MNTSKTPTTPNNDPLRRNITTAVVLSLGLACVLGYLAWSNHIESESDMASESGNGSTSNFDSQVQLQTVGVLKIDPSEATYLPHRYTATVVARRTSQLSFQATERLTEVLVDEGDSVKQGQVLARQDDTALAAIAQAATARLKQTQAALDELVQGPRKETIAGARSEVNRLQAEAKMATATLGRQKQLFKSRAGSAQEYDAARFDSAALVASLESAEHRLAELEAGTRVEQINAQRASVEVARATANQAVIRLKQTALVAPFAGKVARRFADEGSLIQQGSPVLEIIESSALELRFGAAPQIAMKLHLGDTIPFSANGQAFQGTIARINPRLDTATRTREVVVNLAASDAEEIVAGQTVSVEFALQADEPGFWLPSEALLPQVRGLWSVMVLDQRNDDGTDGENESGLPQATVARRDVEVLSTWGTWSRVRGTIDAGDQAVVHGASRVSPGQAVNFKTITFEKPWQQRSAKLLGDNQNKRPSKDSSIEVIQ